MGSLTRIEKEASGNMQNNDKNVIEFEMGLGRKLRIEVGFDDLRIRGWVKISGAVFVEVAHELQSVDGPATATIHQNYSDRAIEVRLDSTDWTNCGMAPVPSMGVRLDPESGNLAVTAFGPKFQRGVKLGALPKKVLA